MNERGRELAFLFHPRLICSTWDPTVTSMLYHASLDFNVGSAFKFASIVGFRTVLSSLKYGKDIGIV